MSFFSFAYRSLPMFFALVLAPSACVFPKVVGGNPQDETGGGTETSGGMATDSLTTDGSPLVCDDNPDLACTKPFDCEQWNCGAVDSPLDASGCLRPACPCGPDEICYGNSHSGACPDVATCADQGDVCGCQAIDCVGGGYCIPADEGPPVECAKITDKDACLAAGCSEFTTVVYASVENDVCVASEVTPLCMWFPGDAWGGNATPGYFYEIATGRAAGFGTDWFTPPYGWAHCTPDVPACGCVGMCVDLNQEADDLLAADKPCVDVSDCALAAAECYDADVCGSVAVHKDTLPAWEQLHSDLMFYECCDGADACVGTLACENQRCVVVQ